MGGTQFLKLADVLKTTVHIEAEYTTNYPNVPISISGKATSPRAMLKQNLSIKSNIFSLYLGALQT